MAETIRELVSEEEVEKRECSELGRQISEDYAGEGMCISSACSREGVFFMCELAKRITVPVSMDFMSVSSYGDGTSSSGVVKIAKDLDEPLEGRDVLIVEDIIDSGRTLSYLIQILERREGRRASRLCTLLDKPERRVKPGEGRTMWALTSRMNLSWDTDSTMRRNTETFPTSV